MAILRTTLPTKIASTLTIYLLLSALCPAGASFFCLPARAADKKEPITAGLPYAFRPADLDRLVAARPTWQNYLQRAKATILYSKDNAGQKSRRAISDCQASLRLQKSPVGLRMLTRSYLLGGSANYKQAAAAAVKYLEATGGIVDGLQLVAFTALLAGDIDGARAALARYTDAEVKAGHPESRAIAMNSLPPDGSPEMQACLQGAFAPATPVHQGQRVLVQALIQFFRGDLDPVCNLTKTYQANCGKLSLPQYRDLAMLLEASAELLKRRHQPAKVLLTELLSRPSPAYETLVLVDDLYFATDKRDEALQLFAERGVAPPTGSSSAGASNRVFQMARVKVLDEYGQPKEALKIMQSLPAALPEVVSLSTQTGLLKNAPVRSDVLFPDTLLERARLESKLNHTADALAHLQNCIEQNPAAGQPYFVRAQIYAQKSQWTLAAADLTRAIDNGFSLIKARRARSACYSSLAQPGPARDDMSLAAAFTRIAE